jgi:hypothetical protein
MSVSSDETTVTISLERLRELEACEAKVTAMKERDKQRFTILAEQKDPKEHAKRRLEHYHANREAILARRRELRKAKKEAAATATATA